MIYIRQAKCALASILLSVTEAGGAAQSDDLQRRAQAFTAMIDAERSKSPVCRGFDNKPVVLTSFDTFVSRLKGPPPKGEYETAEQYRARATRRRPVGGSVVMSIPIDRDYLRYDADTGALMVMAGAFKTGDFGEAPQATIGAEIAMLAVKDKLGSSPRFTIGLPGTERTVSVGKARNAFGASIQTQEVDRHTRGISLTGDSLLPFARDVHAIVSGIQVSVARAAVTKAELRAAIVIAPEAPFVVSNRMLGAAPTNQKPTRYTELSSVLIARPQCALLLNGQSRVVASIDAGGQADGK